MVSGLLVVSSLPALVAAMPEWFEGEKCSDTCAVGYSPILDFHACLAAAASLHPEGAGGYPSKSWEEAPKSLNDQTKPTGCSTSTHYIKGQHGPFGPPLTLEFNNQSNQENLGCGNPPWDRRGQWAGRKANNTFRIICQKQFDPSQNIVEFVKSKDDLSTLAAALVAGNLVETLSSGRFTLFAPLNQAFTKLPDACLSSLLKPENKDVLVEILNNHVVAEEWPFPFGPYGGKKTVGGSTISCFPTQKETELTCWDHSQKREWRSPANLISLDNLAANGIVHTLDNLLLPQTKEFRDLCPAVLV